MLSNGRRLRQPGFDNAAVARGKGRELRLEGGSTEWKSHVLVLASKVQVQYGISDKIRARPPSIDDHRGASEVVAKTCRFLTGSRYTHTDVSYFHPSIAAMLVVG